MIRFYLIRRFLILFLFVGSVQAWAQNRQVTGRVTAEDDGTSLPGVSIIEKATQNGTVTDANGNFTINVKEGATLVFSFVGFASQEVPVGAQNALTVVLKTDITALSEIVVVGYGEQKKEDVTGSLVAITTKDFNKGVMTSPQDLLTGRVSGLTVTNGGGSPTGGSTIRIRGGASLSASNDPLIVIDGFPVDNSGLAGSGNPLSLLNPNDIETFTVLKDASATAIYGLRASNGVIIITTKKGGPGKLKFEYNTQVSLSTLAKKVDVMSGDEYRDYVTEKAKAKTVSGLREPQLVRLGNANTDWQKEIYQNAISHDHNINASGTLKDKIPFRLSYGYTDQKGILKNTELQRNSINLSLSPTFLDDHLKVQANVKSAFTMNNFGNEGAVGAAVRMDPTQPIMNGNTRYGGYFTWTGLSDDLAGGVMNPDGLVNNISPSNPVALIKQTNNRSNIARHIANVQLDYRFHFFPDLRLNVNAGIDYSNSDGHNNQPSDAAFTFRNGPGSFSTYAAENKSQLFDMYLNYVKSNDVHKIDATAGYSFQSFSRKGRSISKKGDGTVTYGDDTDNDKILDAPLENIPSYNDLLSFFGRANYAFKNRYLLTATLRNDYSSRFGPDFRSGLFPAGSIGWNLAEENFMTNVSMLSQLKLRASYGITGQQDLGPSYPYLATYQESQSTAQYQFGNDFINTLRPAAYDGHIKWETTATMNLGLDFGILKDRITGAVEVYNRKTSDLIGFVPVAAGSTFSNYLLTNVGDMDTKGYEVMLNIKPVVKQNLDWTVGVNFTHTQNKITRLSLTNDPNFVVPTGGIAGGVGNMIQQNAVGEPAFSFNTFQQVYTPEGKPIEGLYVDRTGSGGSVVSNNNNKYTHYTPTAKYLVGINTRLNYKKLDFAFASRISLGNYMYNNLRSSSAINSELYNQSGFFGNVPNAVRDTDFNSQQLFSDYYLENASFFKLDNISVGYSFDRVFSEKLKARASFTVRNALVVTKYSGIDPEVGGGIDNTIYPRPRTFLLGINFNF
jgi:TonB-linked SusC/RagA family outer membrane protein